MTAYVRSATGPTSNSGIITPTATRLEHVGRMTGQDTHTNVGGGAS